MAKDSEGNYTREVTPKNITEALAIIDSALAQTEQEPVGYFHLHQYGKSLIHEQVAPEHKGEEGVFPLYAAPVAQPDVQKAGTRITEEKATEIAIGAGMLDFPPSTIRYICQAAIDWAATQAGEAPNELQTAAQAVVDRWDAPLWKDVPATAVYINALRAAIAAQKEQK